MFMLNVLCCHVCVHLKSLCSVQWTFTPNLFIMQLRVSTFWATVLFLALFWESLSYSSWSCIVPWSVAAAAMSGSYGGLPPGRGGEMSGSLPKTLSRIKQFCFRK